MTMLGLELLKAAARQRLAAGQGELDLGLGAGRRAGRCRSPSRGWAACWMRWSMPTGCWGSPMPPAGTRCSPSWCWRGSSSRSASWTALRVLEESRARRAVVPDAHAAPARLCQRRRGGERVSAACAAHAGLGPASLVLYDVSTLYFETDAGDGFREPGSPRSAGWTRRSPSGCSPTPSGFPLMVSRVRGQQGRDQDHAAGDPGVHGRPPAARCDRRRGRRDGVARRTRRQIEAAGLSFILGTTHPRRPLRGRRSGTASTPASPSPTGTSSPSPGQPGPSRRPP